ncbi:MAG TPA: RNA-binding protein [Verrucomicrobiota bacterium]|nr:RNA-binding protein [Verrucomicrobiota bacterium]HNU51641.1 RNA-binding protein [Verrucomicrobiota bacterium]
MTSDDRPPTTGHRYSSGGSKAYGEESTLRTEKIQIERKTFLFALKENPRGRFLRITEDVNGRRDSVIVPSTGLEEFVRVVDAMARESANTPIQGEA